MKRLLLLLVLYQLACVAKASEEQLFTLQLRWHPQAQFLGYYIADELGFYRRAGLDVQILEGGSDVSLMDRVTSGQADVAVEWMPAVIAESGDAAQIVNVAQIFQKAGMTLICHRDRNIRTPQDLRGKTLSVWSGGSEFSLINWLAHFGLHGGNAGQDYHIVEQGDLFTAWNSNEVDCVSSMSYNEYWDLIRSQVAFSETTLFRLDEAGHGVLEDGLYVDRKRLADARFRRNVEAFVGASLAGWQYAIEHPQESINHLLNRFPELDREGQKQMFEEVTKLIDMQQFPLGLLRPGSHDEHHDWLHLQADGSREFKPIHAAHWTHDFWHASQPEGKPFFSIKLRHQLEKILASNWFYALDLIGTLAFGLAGFARAQDKEYDIWGAMVLTSLPAVGGGTLRDMVVSDPDKPPFILNDPYYMGIIIAIVIVGVTMNLLVNQSRSLNVRMPVLMLVIDTIGLAAFAIIGAKVAILAELDWYWIPALAALTCAGGGVMLDVISGREPRTFRGEVYEEIAIAGGLFLLALLLLADYFRADESLIVAAIVATFVLVFTLRIVVSVKGWRAPRLHAAR